MDLFHSLSRSEGREEEKGKNDCDLLHPLFIKTSVQQETEMDYALRFLYATKLRSLSLNFIKEKMGKRLSVFCFFLFLAFFPPGSHIR